MLKLIIKPILVVSLATSTLVIADTSRPDFKAPYDKPFHLYYHISNVSYGVDGSVSFSLYKNTQSRELFMCSNERNDPWFKVTCSPNITPNCHANIDRIGDMLIQAKIADKTVRVERHGCQVHTVFIK